MGRSRAQRYQSRSDGCATDKEKSFLVARNSSIHSRKSSNYSTANKPYSLKSFLKRKNCLDLFMFQQQLTCYSQYLPHLFFVMLRIFVYPVSNLFVLIIKIHLLASSSESNRRVILISYPYHGACIPVPYSSC